jgi:hypothetical protein
MVTEFEVAPLEGAVLSSLPMRMSAVIWKSDAASALSTISQVGVILTIDSRCFRIYVPGTDGSTGAEFGRDGQAGATAETDAPPLRGAPCNCGMLCDDCAVV